MKQIEFTLGEFRREAGKYKRFSLSIGDELSPLKLFTCFDHISICLHPSFIALKGRDGGMTIGFVKRISKGRKNKDGYPYIIYCENYMAESSGGDLKFILTCA